MASLIEANTGAASAHADKEQRLLDVLGRFDGVAGLSGGEWAAAAARRRLNTLPSLAASHIQTPISTPTWMR